MAFDATEASRPMDRPRLAALLGYVTALAATGGVAGGITGAGSGTCASSSVSISSTSTSLLLLPLLAVLLQVVLALLLLLPPHTAADRTPPAALRKVTAVQ